jgi:hypothetical protein
VGEKRICKSCSGKKRGKTEYGAGASDFELLIILQRTIYLLLKYKIDEIHIVIEVVNY